MSTEQEEAQPVGAYFLSLELLKKANEMRLATRKRELKMKDLEKEVENLKEDIKQLMQLLRPGVTLPKFKSLELNPKDKPCAKCGKLCRKDDMFAPQKRVISAEDWMCGECVPRNPIDEHDYDYS